MKFKKSKQKTKKPKTKKPKSKKPKTKKPKFKKPKSKKPKYKKTKKKKTKKKKKKRVRSGFATAMREWYWREDIDEDGDVGEKCARKELPFDREPAHIDGSSDWQQSGTDLEWWTRTEDGKPFYNALKREKIKCAQEGQILCNIKCSDNEILADEVRDKYFWPENLPACSMKKDGTSFSYSDMPEVDFRCKEKPYESSRDRWCRHHPHAEQSLRHGCPDQES